MLTFSNGLIVDWFYLGLRVCVCVTCKH